MKNKITNFLKRINDWFLKPSPLSLLVSLVAPAAFFLLLRSLTLDFPEYMSRFLQMSSYPYAQPYEVWCVALLVSCYFLCWCGCHWLADLVRYIISLFRKSSAPADDK